MIQLAAAGWGGAVLSAMANYLGLLPVGPVHRTRQNARARHRRKQDALPAARPGARGAALRDARGVRPSVLRGQSMTDKPADLRVDTAEIRYFPPGWDDAHRLALETATRIVDPTSRGQS